MPEEVICDTYRMKTGKFKGACLANVPAKHLLWLLENKKSGRITKYIEDNLEVLKKEAKRR